MKITQTRMTKQRKVILEELRKVKSHPTAEEIYALVRARIPHISLGTVYRNLEFLSETGEIRLLSSSGATRRYDGDISPHMHVRCRTCGKVGDVHLPHDADLPDSSSFSPYAEGFSITGSRLEFDGLCSLCAAH